MRRPPPRIARRVALAVLTGLALAACADDGPTAPGAGPGPVAIVAVAALACDRPLPSEGVGVVVGDGIVVTAGHVVEGARREVTVDGLPATVAVVDARTDVAVLRADVRGRVELTDAPSGRLTVATPSGAIDVELVRTGRLIVDDSTDRARYERRVHTVSPDVPAGTSGAALVDGNSLVAGIVVLANRKDHTSYVVTADELRAVLASAPSSAGVACPD